MSLAANAQLISTNNLGIFPPTGPFNPTGKFVALGESGGVPGPAPSGCDLYGFRSQFTDVLNVNLGMEPLSATFAVPTLAFECPRPFLIKQQNSSGSGTGSSFDSACGKTLAWYFDSVTGGGATNVVYQVFGSAFASGGTWAPSDKNLKRNIQLVQNPMEILSEIRGVTYEYRTDERPELNLNKGLQYGFIAQEVQEVMPEATQNVYDAEGELADYIAMNYDMIIPVLTEAVKQQDETIRYQEDQITDLEDRIARLENMVNQLTGTQPTNSAVSLRQNRPNPVNGLTTIEYDIPMDMTNADMVIYDVRGVELERVRIESGQGMVDYNAGNLSGGVYFYTIEVNGKNLARQKMIIK